MDDKIIPLGSFVPYFYSPDNDSFSMQIGGTVYEVTTHFDTDGKRNRPKAVPGLASGTASYLTLHIRQCGHCMVYWHHPAMPGCQKGD